MSIEKVRTSFEKFKEAFDPSFQETPPLQKMPRELAGLNPGWIEDLLGMLSGDLNHDRVAEVKQKLRDGLDCQRFIRQDGANARGCLFSGTGRGDCEHFVGLPGKSIPSTHDGPDDTVDEYGRPNGWCEVCWLSQQLKYAHDELYLFADNHGGEKYADGVLTLVKNEAGKHLQHRVRRLRLRAGGEYTAHIIEAKKLTENGCPVYLRFREPNVWVWTPDIDLAFQFGRIIDAERYAGKNDGTWKIEEHGFAKIG